MRTVRSRFFLAACMLAPAAGLALDTDRDQPMHVEADRATMDEGKGVGIYRGDVRIRQGSMRLEADTVTLYLENGRIVRAVAVGEPARYRQRPEGREQDIHAEARRMEYTLEPERIVLTGDAIVRQSGDTFRSERIVYDIVRDTVDAGTDEDRVRIVIQPRRKNDGAATPDTPAE